MLNIKKHLIGICVIAFTVSLAIGLCFGLSSAVADENANFVGEQESQANGFSVNVRYVDTANNPLAFIRLEGKLATKQIKIIDTTWGTTDANGECTMTFSEEMPSGGSFSIGIMEGQGYEPTYNTSGGLLVASKYYNVVVNLNGGKIISGTPADHKWKDNGNGTWSTTVSESRHDNVATVIDDWANVKIERNGAVLNTFQPNVGPLWHDVINKNFTTNIIAVYNDEPQPGPTPPGPVPPGPTPPGPAPVPTPDNPGGNTGGTITQTSDSMPIAMLFVFFVVAGTGLLISRKKFN